MTGVQFSVEMSTNLYYERNMVLYSWEYGKHLPKAECKSLVYFASKIIVADYSTVKRIAKTLPIPLLRCLMKVAFLTGRHRALSETILQCKFNELVMQRDVMPDFGTFVCCEMLNNRPGSQMCCNYKDDVKSIMECCGTILITLHDSLKQDNSASLFLDLSGFPIDTSLFIGLLRSLLLHIKKTPQHCHASTSGPKLTLCLNLVIIEETVIFFLNALRVIKVYKSNVEIQFSRIVINSIGGRQFLKVLSMLDKDVVKALDIQYNNIAAEYIADVMQIIERFKSLDTLVLGRNMFDMINYFGVSYVGHAFGQCPCLKRLDIACTKLTNLLQMILVQTHSLEVLNVQSCQLSPKDIRYLCSSDHVSTLLEINLSGNNMGNCFSDFLLLLDGMANQLEVLSMEDVHVTENFQVHQIISHIAEYKNLKALTINYTGDTLEEVSKMGTMLSLAVFHTAPVSAESIVTGTTSIYDFIH